MTEPARTKSIVAGIDGSKAAIRAALWAVDEAVSRDVPLRLLYATERGDSQVTAEMAVRQAVTAIQAAGKPVKIETGIVHGPAVGSLIRSSASAAMVCVGAVGLRHFQPGRVGSTAAALAISARCPVAIVRGRDDHRRQPGEKIGRRDRRVPGPEYCWAPPSRRPCCAAPPCRRSSRGEPGRPNTACGVAKPIAGRSPTSIAGWPGGSDVIRSCGSNRSRYTSACSNTWPARAGRWLGDRRCPQSSARGRTRRTGRQCGDAGRQLFAVDRESATFVSSDDCEMWDIEPGHCTGRKGW